MKRILKHKNVNSQILIIGLVYVIRFDAIAQMPSNSIYYELLGPGVTMSLNYERNFYLNETSHLSFNVGFGSPEKKHPEYPFIPLTVAYNIGRNKRFLETGLGYTYRTNPEGSMHFVLGFKRMAKNGLLFKYRFTPFLNFKQDSVDFLPWVGFAVLGYSF